MASFLELDCSCGAKLHIPESCFESGGSARCEACGAEFLFELEEPDFSGGDLFPGDAAGGFGAPGARGSPAIGDPALQCPSCGGQAQVAYRGPAGRDRVLECPYCRTEVDLPEARGVTRERVTERPNEKIVERFSEWEGLEPERGEGVGDPEHGFQSQKRVTEYSSVVTRELGGESFGERDRPIPAEMLAKIRKHFKRKA